MNVTVIGGNGQLGRDVVDAFETNHDHVSSITHAEMEVRNLDSVKACLEQSNPDVVVNTAAMHHVENCERDPDAAYAVNATGARNLAVITRDLGATLIHVSTDYVFDGKKGTPYVEGDAPLPLNVYGNSKLAGEYYVRTLNEKHFVLRTSALYGKHQCRAKGGRNFVDLMLDLGRTRGKVRVVNSEFVSPTSTTDVARQIVSMSRCESYGLYHATAESSCSWHEFAHQIFALSGVQVDLQVAAPDEFPAKTPRPAYSVLENHKLKKLGLNMFPSWQEGLEKYLANMPVPAVSNSA